MPRRREPEADPEGFDLPDDLDPGDPRAVTARLKKALTVLPPRVRDAVRFGHAALERLGGTHVLTGRIAARVHGAVCPIERVDFALLPGPRVWPDGSLRVIPNGAPSDVRGLPVRYVGVSEDLADVRPCTYPTDYTLPGVFRAEPLALVLLRERDGEAVVALLRAGADLGEVRWLVGRFSPSLGVSLQTLAEQAGSAPAAR